MLLTAAGFGAFIRRPSFTYPYGCGIMMKTAAAESAEGEKIFELNDTSKAEKPGCEFGREYVCCYAD